MVCKQGETVCGADCVDTQVSCWGDRPDGRIGNGNSVASTSTAPVTVPSITDAVAVFASDRHCAQLSDGAVWCWGHTGDGKLGNNATSTQTSSVQVVMLPP